MTKDSEPNLSILSSELNSVINGFCIWRVTEIRNVSKLSKWWGRLFYRVVMTFYVKSA